MAGTGRINSGGDRRGSTIAVGGAREMVAAGVVVAAVDMAGSRRLGLFRVMATRSRAAVVGGGRLWLVVACRGCG
jgi:hypothetical protein